ncbi:hypothetical protein [Lactococcus garvieae]|nr:hypothetical protein [Lactococcus garvieae]
MMKLAIVVFPAFFVKLFKETSLPNESLAEIWTFSLSSKTS